MHRLLRLLLVLSMLLSAAAPGLAQIYERRGLDKTLYYRVVIDAQGKLASAQPVNQTPGADVLRAGFAAARQVVFEPARVDGKPVASETGLQLGIRFVAQPDRTYKTEVRFARLGPQAIGVSQVTYAKRHSRSATGVVFAAVAVQADGSVDASKSRILQTATSKAGEPHKATFERDTLASVNQYRFQPDLVDGRPVASEGVVAVRFCTTDCSDYMDPEPNAERLALPRSLTPEVELARVRP